MYVCHYSFVFEDLNDNKGVDWRVLVQGVTVSQIKTGLNQVGMWDKKRGVTVTGYSALAAFTALCTVIILGLYTVYNRYRGIKGEYAVVLKSGDV